MQIYLNLNGEQVGPYGIEDIQGWLRAGHVKLEDQAWYDGCGDWILIQDLPGIRKSAAGHASSTDLIPPFEAYEGTEPFIFISYAHRDSEIVYEEITELHESGYKIWYDEGIEASNEWPEEIANAVIGCAVFVVFVSPRSTSSVNCRNEINLALNENKPFLAIHLEESSLPPGLRLRMGDLQAILRYKLTRDRYLKKVNGTLDQLLSKEETAPTLQAPTQPQKPRKKESFSNSTQVVLEKKQKGSRNLLIILGSLVLVAVLAFMFLPKKEDAGSSYEKGNDQSAGVSSGNERKDDDHLGAGPWVSMFDGETLTGWKASEDDRVFAVLDGNILIRGTARAHLFYETVPWLENFEFKAQVYCYPVVNSGIYFHTLYKDSGWPSKGFECQILNSHKNEKRKTGSLYGVVDEVRTLVKDNEWFEYFIRVKGKKVLIKINGETTVDWTEPPTRMAYQGGNFERKLGMGYFALQSHPDSNVVMMKDLYYRRLP